MKRISYILLFISAISFVGLFFIDPIPQSLQYHQFADSKSLLGIPNFFDVISNFGFLVVGLYGIFLARSINQSKFAWISFFVGVTFVSIGSSYYHWAPSNSTLVWDRLPMAMGFMGLFVAFLSEIIDQKCEKYLLIPLILAGMGSVIYWHYADDLRVYVLVQVLPIISILAGVIIERPKGSKFWILGMIFYGFAKLCEFYDGQIYTLLNEVVSGHTLKHLIAALGIHCFSVLLKYKNSNLANIK